MAERTRVAPALLRSLEASRVLRPRRVGGEARYTVFDVRAVKMLLSLLGSGLPMEEFMRVAQVQLEAVDEVAEGDTIEWTLRRLRDRLPEMLESAGAGADGGPSATAALAQEVRAATTELDTALERVGELLQQARVLAEARAG